MFIRLMDLPEGRRIPLQFNRKDSVADEELSRSDQYQRP